MSDLLPNMAIIRSPSNWFLVAFSLAILAFISHVVFEDKINGR